MFPILNTPPSSLPVPSLWVIPVHQPQASSIVHQTWTGDSFHIWYYTCFNAILPNHPTSPSPTESKRLFYTSVSLLLSRIQGYCYHLPKFHIYALVYCIGGEGNGTPLQYSCLENPMDGGAWKAAVYGVTEGRIRLSVFTFAFHLHALEKEMATHSSVLEPGESQGQGSLVGCHLWGRTESDTTEVT